MRASSLLEYWLGINIELSLYCYLGTKIQQLVSSLVNTSTIIKKTNKNI